MDIPRCKAQNVPSRFPEPFINGFVSSQAISYLAGYPIDKYGDLLIHELKVRNGKRSISAWSSNLILLGRLEARPSITLRAFSSSGEQLPTAGSSSPARSPPCGGCPAGAYWQRLRIEGQTLANLRLGFALVRGPGKIESLALKQLATVGDRLGVGRPGFLALGVAEFLVDPRANAKFEGLRRAGRGENRERLCYTVSSRCLTIESGCARSTCPANCKRSVQRPKAKATSSRSGMPVP